MAKQNETQAANDTQVVNNEVSNNANREVITAKIVKMGLAKDINGDVDLNRITIQLDKEFKTINQSTNEEHMTSTFGINVNALIIQIKSFVPIIQTLECVYMGNAIPNQMLNLALINAEVTVVRDFKAKGEAREYKEECYSNDCYVSKVVSVTPHVSSLNEQLINRQIINALDNGVQTSSKPINVFGI